MYSIKSEPYKKRTYKKQNYKKKLIHSMVVPAPQHPQTTYEPHTRPGVGNGGGRRVHQGSTCPAHVPLDSTPLCKDILHCGNPTLRKQRCRHRTFLFCHI